MLDWIDWFPFLTGPLQDEEWTMSSPRRRRPSKEPNGATLSLFEESKATSGETVESSSLKTKQTNKPSDKASNKKKKKHTKKTTTTSAVSSLQRGQKTPQQDQAKSPHKSPSRRNTALPSRNDTLLGGGNAPALSDLTDAATALLAIQESQVGGWLHACCCVGHMMVVSICALLHSMCATRMQQGCIKNASIDIF